TDPRKDSDPDLRNQLDDYWVTEGSWYYNNGGTNDQFDTTNKTLGSWSSFTTKIKEGNSAPDAIAPDFLICSNYGRTKGENAQDFETFRKRCATYQEAGYPAGRWRLPTEAEINFIYKLQGLGVIPEFFQENNSAYWASSGRAAVSYDYNTGNVVFSDSPNVGGAGRAGVRCIYDLWYWGDDPKEPNKFWAMPYKE
nr:hypothetical protein [Bacteroidaceae bacterium]